MLQYMLLSIALGYLAAPAVRSDSGKATCPWDSTKNWKIYHLPNTNREIRISADSLRFLTNLPLNDDSIHSLMCQVKKRVVKGPVLFQGAYLASYEATNGETVKVLISTSVAFLYVPRDDAYFELQVDAEILQNWSTFFLNTYMKMEK
jgi:hypothetical protein